MSDAKIQITVGSIGFSGEGEPAWLETQLDKVLKAVPELLRMVPEVDGEEQKESKAKRKVGTGKTLASFLSEKNASSNQTKKFLATAAWLHEKGKTRLTTKDVTKAISENHQKRLGNPADSLNKNVSKGHCQKEGSEFYVTPEGLATL